MTERRYRWGRCAGLLREADYGLPSLVWWWPINWLIVAIGLPMLVVRDIWRTVRRHD